MRDDIHRKLPLPAYWRRLVRACSRDSEERERPDRAYHAAAAELRRLNRSLVAAARATDQPELFGQPNRRLSTMAASPVDHLFVREMAISKHADRDVAITYSVQRALMSMVEAQGRQIRIHASEVDPRSCPVLMRRIEAATSDGKLDELVRGFVNGDPLPGRYRRRFDVDADLRS